MPRRPYTFDRVVRILFAIAGLVVGIWFVNSIKSALLPFFVAWLIAYLLNPLVNFAQFNLRLRNRVLSVILTLLFLLVVLTSGVLLLIRPVGEQINHLVLAISNLEQTSGTQTFIPKEFLDYINSRLSMSELSELITAKDLRDIAQVVLPKLTEIITDTLGMLVSVIASFIALIYLVFILIDYERISHGWIRLVPIKCRAIVTTVANDVKQGMNRYFRGQALVAFIVGVLFSIGFTIIGLPLSIFLGLFIGLLNMVPYLQIVGILPMAMLCFIKSGETGDSFIMIFALSMLVLAIVQIIQDTFLVPKIMGKVTGLNPAVILLSLSVWGTLLGIIGMIIALPMTSLLLSYYQRFILMEEDTVEKNKNP